MSAPAMSAEDLRHRVSQIRWFHQIDLGQGVVTPGLVDTQATLARLHMPADLSGRSVLDIGAWDGFYSFEAERRGAARVLATDSFSWGGGGWGTKAGFDLARQALQSRIEDQPIDVLDLAPDTTGVFDVVLFLGVLYHMRHPLLALERVASVTGDLLILETHVDLDGMRRPAMVFYPDRELNGDPTNWWGPNPRAVCDMLRCVGFRQVEVASTMSTRPRRVYSAVKSALLRRGRFSDVAQRNRIVIHARK